MNTMDEPPASRSSEPPGGAAPDALHVTLTPSELELIRTALDFLRSTLGREEADELDAVQALLARLSRTGTDDRSAA